MLFYGAILFVLVFDYVYCEDVCPYLDAIGKRHYRKCDNGCCGNLRNAFCCQQKYLAVIVLGSVVGFFLLIVVIVVTIHCCYRRRQVKVEYLRVTRNYGTIRVPEGATNGSSNIAEVENVVTVPEVEITVTPATPQGAEQKTLLHPVSERPTVPAISENTTDAEKADDNSGLEDKDRQNETYNG